jgi:RNA polymerase sigma-70 factor (ECF subfamily)
MTMVGSLREQSVRAEATDEELVDRIGRGDQSALREVVAQHGGRVLAIAVRTLRDAARAEEVVQDTFLALWTQPGAFDPYRGTLRSFLLGIAHHKSVDAVRKQAARDRATGRLLESDERLAETTTALGPSDAAPDVLAALKTLSPRLKETMFLAFYMGLTYREVAVELGIPEGTAKSRIRFALERLRAELSERGSLSGS